MPEDEHGIDPDTLQQSLATLGPRCDRIRFMYLVTVNNPTCSILSNARRRHVVELIEQLSHQLDRKVPIILDTAYELLIHDPKVEKPQSALLNDP